ncbi:putative cyclic nucleotide-gated ion channel 8 [Andrographis paniculata]|uniref:putative cyclic nucleotide-gated ion channel 8 n=1 Tax=Andrographis paniculata TaxID=175694 RepID=UPI0021E8A8E8|nr:putative cyclic nucleotide-gated ion channel 8 [Andrographis paniculata]
MYDSDNRKSWRTVAFRSDMAGKNIPGFSIEGLGTQGASTTKSQSISFRVGFQRGSEGLLTFGRSLTSGVTRAVFPEDLKVSDKRIFDPQDKSLLLWNKLFLVSCILSVSIDPLFLYLPVFQEENMCLHMDNSLAYTTTSLRTAVDLFYILRICLQFRTAFIAPSSRVFGRGELVIDPTEIATRYIHRYFFVDLASVLPIPQIVTLRFLHKAKGSDVLGTKQALVLIVFLQYIPRFLRFVPLTSELKKTAGVFAETAWAGAAYYLLWFLLASHVFGALWYLLAIERKDTCWNMACSESADCDVNNLYCANGVSNLEQWRDIGKIVLEPKCAVKDEQSKFKYGIYLQALSSGVLESEAFFSKYFYCLWWGLQNLSTLGQGLSSSTYPGEVLFSITVCISGLLLFALLIGNMQTYLQSLSVRLEEMRVKRRDSEQWMHHRVLPPELRERVRRYDQYKWLETRGVDEESLVQSLPKDLRRDIKRHLCLNLVRRVPLFANMDDRLLDAICERLKPSLLTEKTYVLREGDPVDEMLFIIRGRLESVTTDGGRSGFYNRGILKEADFCGEELLTWALDPKSASNLPPSTRTVKALTEVEAFALSADELKFITSQFRRIHSRQVQQTFRFYSQQWRTWAATFIQATWRRYRRKVAELEHNESDKGSTEESSSDGEDGSDNNDDEHTGLISGTKTRLGSAMLASRFAANAMRRVHRFRSELSSGKIRKLPKPPEPDFSTE